MERTLCACLAASHMKVPRDVAGGEGKAGLPQQEGCTACLIRLVLCVATANSYSTSQLSLKFGAALASCRHLLENAKKSQVEVVGVR